jgi:hypothetical protein
MISDTVQKSKLALIKGNPTTTKENIFYFAYSNEKMESNVSTIVMFDTPCIAALNFKLRYKNLELNFIDSKKQNWRYNPTFVVTKPGNYKLSYKNRKVENINKSWTLEFLG